MICFYYHLLAHNRRICPSHSLEASFGERDNTNRLKAENYKSTNVLWDYWDSILLEFHTVHCCTVAFLNEDVNVFWCVSGIVNGPFGTKRCYKYLHYMLVSNVTRYCFPSFTSQIFKIVSSQLLYRSSFDQVLCHSSTEFQQSTNQ